jgi:hypothetical protein
MRGRRVLREAKPLFDSSIPAPFEGFNPSIFPL